MKFHFNTDVYHGSWFYDMYTFYDIYTFLFIYTQDKHLALIWTKKARKALRTVQFMDDL